MIDENRIQNNLETFCFPRLSGTEEEKKAFNIARTEIEKLKLTPSVQKFSFSTFYSRVYPKIAVLLISWLFFVLIISSDMFFLITNLVIVLLVLLFFIVYTRKPENIRIGKRLSSQSLFAKIPSKSSNNNKRNILFFSHLDSKGQKLSIDCRIKSFKYWVLSLISLGIVVILKNIFFVGNILIFIIGIIFLAIHVLITTFILINTTNNQSKGALDDASGIACVLELLNYYTKTENRLENYNSWFVFTGAEESGTIGIRHFYKLIKHFDRKGSFIFNLDSIGKKIDAYVSNASMKKFPKFYDFFMKEAKKYKVRLNIGSKFNFGVHSDGIYLASKKFSGLGFGDISSYMHIHSVNDTLDKVDPIALKNLVLVLTNFLKDIDQNYLII